MPNQKRQTSSPGRLKSQLLDPFYRRAGAPFALVPSTHRAFEPLASYLPKLLGQRYSRYLPSYLSQPSSFARVKWFVLAGKINEPPSILPLKSRHPRQTTYKTNEPGPEISDENPQLIYPVHCTLGSRPLPSALLRRSCENKNLRAKLSSHHCLPTSVPVEALCTSATDPLHLELQQLRTYCAVLCTGLTTTTKTRISSSFRDLRDIDQTKDFQA
jgi:hypothetical protein